METAFMNHRETVAAIARKLRHFTQRDVSECLTH